MKASSSLQRAAQQGRLEVQKGAFEACFSEGLDLSEFGKATSPNSSTAFTSASAVLLQIKEEEKKLKEREENEEIRMQSTVQQRIQSLKESSSKRKEEDALRAAPPGSSDGANDLMKGSIFGAVVGMHSSDKYEPRAKLKREKRSASKRHKAADLKSSNSSKGRVNKKSRRSKY